MTRLLQHLFSTATDPTAREPREVALRAAAEDDIALGFECATPALQFESWDPAPAAQDACPAY